MAEDFDWSQRADPGCRKPNLDVPQRGRCYNSRQEHSLSHLISFSSLEGGEEMYVCRSVDLECG